MDAPALSAATLRQSLSFARPLPVIDVRKGPMFLGTRDLISGALRRDPERVDEWAGELVGAEVLVYCVYGHVVGQSTAARLRDAGVSARFLAGRIENWKKSGRPTQAK